MATSGSVAFEPSITQCIEEAYERCQVQLTSGYSLKTALFSLNILFSEWGNRGIHFWEVANTNLYITSGQATFDVYKNSTARGSVVTNPATTDNATYVYNASDILTASYRTGTGTDQSDITLTKIDRSTYAALTNKNSQGVPSQFWIQRFIDKTTLTLYITPGASQATNHINVYYIKRIQDAGIAVPDTGYTDQTTNTSAYANKADVPFRFYPCLVSGLAFYLSKKINPAKTQELKMYYEDELARALAEDGSASSAFVTPQTYYPAVS